MCGGGMALLYRDSHVKKTDADEKESFGFFEWIDQQPCMFTQPPHCHSLSTTELR